ncbi:MAG: Fe(3+) ABC transporter substrate-binding protein [Pseudomonadota bacterium]
MEMTEMLFYKKMHGQMHGRMHRGIHGLATRRLAVMAGGALVAGVMFASAMAHAATLNIYSHRQPFLLEPLLEAYKAKYDTDINIVYASKGLVQRLKAEGANSPADLILTVDISRISQYAENDLLQKVNSPTMNASVPARLRDPEGHWFAFSNRARILVVDKNMPESERPRSYEDLADSRWNGRICTRPGSHVYNRALLASIIAAHGEETALGWTKALVGNLARKPQGNDRAQARAIMEGVCDVAIMNSYYYGKMLDNPDSPEQKAWADAITLIFPNQDGRGTHMNISGGGIAKHAPNRAEALRFMEFLVSPEAQRIYANVNFEYPVNAEAGPVLQSWGTFRADQLSINEIARLAPTAQRLINEAGW